MNPLHHLHRRKRIHTKKERYPAKHPTKRFVDHLIYAVGMFVPAMTAIQSAKIWGEQDASGVSMLTFGGFVLANFIWLWYGILHREKPIIFMYALQVVFNGSIVAGVLIYS